MGVPAEAVAEAYDKWEKGEVSSPLTAAAISNQTIQESMRLLLMVRAFQVMGHYAGAHRLPFLVLCPVCTAVGRTELLRCCSMWAAAGTPWRMPLLVAAADLLLPVVLEAVLLLWTVLLLLLLRAVLLVCVSCWLLSQRTAAAPGPTAVLQPLLGSLLPLPCHPLFAAPQPSWATPGQRPAASGHGTGPRLPRIPPRASHASPATPPPALLQPS